MPVTDAVLYIHGTGTGQGPVTNTAGVLGDNIFQTTTVANEYSNLELDFGSNLSGSSVYPYLPAFPSLNEKGYTFPPEVVGDGGVELGLHLIVGTACTGTGFTGGVVNVLSNSTTAATSIIASRTLTSAQLGTAGLHYFVPVNFVAVLEFLRCNFVPSSAAGAAGTGIVWFGPKTGGEQ